MLAGFGRITRKFPWDKPLQEEYLEREEHGWRKVSSWCCCGMSGWKSRLGSSWEEPVLYTREFGLCPKCCRGMF